MTFGLQCDEPTAAAILDRAAEGGIDFIDTSDAYPLGGDLTTRGITEEILGRWLQGKRDRFIVATKCFAPTGPAPFDAGNSRKHILAAVDASLRRLQTRKRRSTRRWAPSTTSSIKGRSATSAAQTF
jgi:aryl-alcohol dehydrogenase (NADP+)